MESKDLAVVFGPVLIWSPINTDLALVRDLPTINRVTQLGIDHHEFVFQGRIQDFLKGGFCYK